MSMQEQIEAKLSAAFAPTRMRIDNDSHQHSGAASNSHFRVILVAEQFEGMSPVARQRAVFSCLRGELAGSVHALQMKCMTPAEYADAQGQVSLEVPPCGGGPKA